MSGYFPRSNVASDPNDKIDGSIICFNAKDRFDVRYLSIDRCAAVASDEKDAVNLLLELGFPVRFKPVDVSRSRIAQRFRVLQLTLEECRVCEILVFNAELQRQR